MEHASWEHEAAANVTVRSHRPPGTEAMDGSGGARNDRLEYTDELEVRSMNGADDLDSEHEPTTAGEEWAVDGDGYDPSVAGREAGAIGSYLDESGQPTDRNRGRSSKKGRSRKSGKSGKSEGDEDGEWEVGDDEEDWEVDDAEMVDEGAAEAGGEVAAELEDLAEEEEADVWVPPSLEMAAKHREETVFGGGALPLWTTNLTGNPDLSRGDVTYATPPRAVTVWNPQPSPALPCAALLRPVLTAARQLTRVYARSPPCLPFRCRRGAALPLPPRHGRVRRGDDGPRGAVPALLHHGHPHPKSPAR